MLFKALSHDIGLKCQFSRRRNNDSSNGPWLTVNFRFHQNLKYGNQKRKGLSRASARARVDVLVGEEVGDDSRLNGRSRREMHLLQRVQYLGE